ncbi:MAG: alpha/beta fold hydrolase [Burkholderiales bacterium]
MLGARDVMTPPGAASALAQAIAGSRTVTLAPSGHSLMAEEPDATRDALIAFMQ